MMYETFDHTADLGLRIRSDRLEQVFVEAAQALFSTIAPETDAIEPRQEVTVEFENDDLSLLLFDWLKELLYHFDAEHLLFRTFDVRIEGNRLTGTARGEPLDPARHRLEHEVKAITYHGLRLEKDEAGWLAEVIVDI